MKTNAKRSILLLSCLACLSLGSAAFEREEPLRARLRSTSEDRNEEFHPFFDDAKTLSKHGHHLYTLTRGDDFKRSRSIPHWTDINYSDFLSQEEDVRYRCLSVSTPPHWQPEHLLGAFPCVRNGGCNIIKRCIGGTCYGQDCNENAIATKCMAQICYRFQTRSQSLPTLRPTLKTRMLKKRYKLPLSDCISSYCSGLDEAKKPYCIYARCHRA